MSPVNGGLLYYKDENCYVKGQQPIGVISLSTTSSSSSPSPLERNFYLVQGYGGKAPTNFVFCLRGNAGSEAVMRVFAAESDAIRTQWLLYFNLLKSHNKLN